MEYQVRPSPHRWFLDEVYIEIRGKKLWLWRAVDDSGAVLDLLLQDRRDTQAAKTFLGRLLVNYDVPDLIHTDKLWSYGAAIRELPVLHSVEHVQVISTARCNNLIEQSHRPTRQQERSGQAFSWALLCPRSQIGFKNQRRAQEFLALRTFNSIPAQQFLPTFEDRTRTVPTWHGRTQLKWPPELQTATDLTRPLPN